jgi:predicted small secreted protein
MRRLLGVLATVAVLLSACTGGAGTDPKDAGRAPATTAPTPPTTAVPQPLPWGHFCPTSTETVCVRDADGKVIAYNDTRTR